MKLKTMTPTHLHNLISREHDLLGLINQKQGSIGQWLHQNEKTNELPLYSSVDIRDAGFKMAVVDTNIFPAGFNNLCEHGLQDAALFLKLAIQKRVPHAKNILIIAEEHTRNTWYLENVRILEKIISDAGFHTTVATFLTVQPAFCEKTNFVEFKTATDQSLRVHCLKNVLDNFQTGKQNIDLVILNNDLSSGIPDILKQSPIPIYPSIQAGWHSRLKSLHFNHYDELLKELSNILEIDPWLFSTLHTNIENLNINDEKNRINLQDIAADLLQKISSKYKEHRIDEKPYLVIKSNYGTYGMGVMAVEDASEIATLNSKKRNKLSSGKGSRKNEHYIIQEGVSTIYQIGAEVSEACMYQIENHLIGGFFRTHAGKTARQSLNTKGMNFKRMCPHQDEHRECLFFQGNHDRPLAVFDIYRLLARIAAVAAHREIIALEEKIL